ncbi:MAG: DEAD/DEAH box helicase family protein [Bacteroidia bacterium]|nr:DEAD/DEAH box helicase family protein [Bacteroidia bacterium]
MGKSKKASKEDDLFGIAEQMKTAVCVPAIRNAVDVWRSSGYKGVTDTTHELLNFWFKTDHRLPTGRSFSYYAAQRESIETLVYLYEVAKTRSRKALLEQYAYDTKDLRLPPYDDFARYCIKMATGSGKTKVMALSIVWHYFNAVREDSEDFAKTYLVIAPNVIVFERLRTDFASGHIFKADPMFPKHFEMFWDFECYMRGDGERACSEGALFLTNIQQFYERPNSQNGNEPDVMTAVLGQKPKTEKMDISDFDERIENRDGLLLVVNDEAHHTHDEESEWNNVIRRLHTSTSIASQLDFSATPRYSKGGLFAWTVYDYPLKQAILDNIVKRPVKGIAKVTEAKSNVASTRYAGFLIAGVERWKEYNKQLQPLKKKPILFIMMNSTAEADDIGEWLRTKYPKEFAGDRTLVIHTNRVGEIVKGEEDSARRLAREVDEDESPVNAIVSVLMLREGWDVQNVTVVVGLRPYTAKANILPEQTIGRGLRLMFRTAGSGYTERVDIIGNKAFLEFVEELETLEGLKLDTFELGKDKLKIITIQPIDEKLKADIGVPDISPSLVRKTSLADDIAGLDVTKFKINPLPLTAEEQSSKSFQYEGRDILTDEILFSREFTLPPAQTAQEVIGYYARRIAANLKLPSQFAALTPKLKEFFEKKAFGKEVELNDPAVVQAMSSNLASYVVTKEFEKALRDIIVEEKTPVLLTPERLLSSTPPFPFSSKRKILESKKCVFNYVPCDNELEYAFAKFLNAADDVEAFAKIPEQFGFAIEYPDSLSNIRNYFSDFVARLTDGTRWIIETKGREDIEVRLKDQAAERWCENATLLTQHSWSYLKVPQSDFEKLRPSRFAELASCLSIDKLAFTNE